MQQKINTQTKSSLVFMDMDSTISDHFLQSVLFNISNTTQFIHQPYKWTDVIDKYISQNTYPLQEIKSELKKIPLVSGMRQLLEYLHSRGDNIIIISAGNIFLLKLYLQLHNIDIYVKDCYARKAQYKQQEMIINFPVQQNKCQKNIQSCYQACFCKALILNKIILQSNQEYENIMYIGDGKNDLCPISELKNQNVFVRKDYALHSLLTNQSQKHQLSNNIHYWNTGFDIVNIMKI